MLQSSALAYTKKVQPHTHTHQTRNRDHVVETHTHTYRPTERCVEIMEIVIKIIAAQQSIEIEAIKPTKGRDEANNWRADWQG